MKVKNILIILLVVFGAVIVLSFSNLFSLIGIDENDYPTCEIPMNGGSCDLFLELPAGLMVDSGYSFDIRTKPVPEDEFKDRQQLNLVGDAGPFLENRVTYTNSWWEIEHNLYLYSIPNSWRDVYEYKLEYVSDEQASLRVYNEGYGYLEMFIGFVTVPYPFSNPIICNNYATTWCRENIPNYIIQSSFDEGQWNYRDYRTNYIQRDTNSLLSAKASDGTVRMTMSGERIVSGTLMPDTDRKVVIKTEQELQDYGSLTGMTRQPQITFPKPPRVYASYKQNHYLTNLNVVVGGEQVYFKEGKLDAGLLFLPDISEAVNSFCGRLDDNQRDTDCIVRMRFESDNAGVIQVIGDLGVLKQTIPIEVSENVFSEPKSFSIFHNTVGGVAIIGFLIVVLVFIIYFVRGGKL